MRGRVLRGFYPRFISDAPAGLRGNGIREFLTFQTASQQRTAPVDEAMRSRTAHSHSTAGAIKVAPRGPLQA